MSAMPSNDEVMKKFGYELCEGPCHGEHLAFSLRDGLCYWCHAKVRRGMLPGQLRESERER